MNRVSFALIVTASLATLSGVTATAQIPYLTYRLHSTAGDKFASGTNDKSNLNTDLNPYDYRFGFDDGVSIRRDVFIGSDDVGIEAESSADVTAIKDNLSVSATADSQKAILSEFGFSTPDAAASVDAFYAIPLRYVVATPGLPWRCIVSVNGPTIGLSVGPGASAIAAAGIGLDNQTHYSLTESKDEFSSTYSVWQDAPFNQHGAGDETHVVDETFVAEAGLRATNPSEVPTSAVASIDPGLPLVFSDLSPGLTIMGPDGHIYASSVVPEPSSLAWMAAALSALGLGLRKLKRK